MHVLRTHPFFCPIIHQSPFLSSQQYGVIPVQDRLLWVDAVEIIWVTILATQAAALADKSEEEVAVEACR